MLMTWFFCAYASSNTNGLINAAVKIKRMKSRFTTENHEYSLRGFLAVICTKLNFRSKLL